MVFKFKPPQCSDSQSPLTKFGVFKDVLQKDNRCLRIVESGLSSAGLPCSWVEVVKRCRLTRQLVVAG